MRGGSAGKQTILWGVVLLGAILAFMPGVVLSGHVALPTELVFNYPPWSAYAPEETPGVANVLTEEAVTFLFKNYALTQRAFQEGSWPLWKASPR